MLWQQQALTAERAVWDKSTASKGRFSSHWHLRDQSWNSRSHFESLRVRNAQTGVEECRGTEMVRSGSTGHRQEPEGLGVCQPEAKLKGHCSNALYTKGLLQKRLNFPQVPRATDQEVTRESSCKYQNVHHRQWQTAQGGEHPSVESFRPTGAHPEQPSCRKIITGTFRGWAATGTGSFRAWSMSQAPQCFRDTCTLICSGS